MYDGACMLLFTSKKTFKKKSIGQTEKKFKKESKAQKKNSQKKPKGRKR